MMARPKETGLSAAFQEKQAQEKDRLEGRLARLLRADMTRLLEEGIHSDLALVVAGTTFSVHRAILQQRAPSFYNKYIQGTDTDSVTIETDDGAGLQTFIRGVYTEDTLAGSSWNISETGDITEVKPSIDANGNGQVEVDNCVEEFPINGNTTSPVQADSENPGTWSMKEGCCQLGTDLLTMYHNKCNTDIVLLAQGKQFHAHRSILCARSSYFSAMLGGGWLESSAQEVNLESVSGSVVEQALLFAYGGRAELSPSCNLGELVVVGDMYGIAGIKDIAAFMLKRDYCHFFHKPCTGCLVGVCETLPLAISFGHGDIQERCLRWSSKHFVRLWPTKPFALLPQEVQEKCFANLQNDINQQTVLDIIMDAERLLGVMPQLRWADPVVTLANRLMDTCIIYLGNNIVEVMGTEKFLSLSKTMALGIDMLLDVMRRGIVVMPVQCACRTYLHCRQLSQNADNEQCDWNEDFKSLVRAVYKASEQYMHQYVNRVVSTDDWKLLSQTDQARIKEGGFFMVPDETKKPAFKPHPKATGASRPTMLPSQRRARGSRPSSSSKTPLSGPASPASASSGGRTPQTPSAKKGGSSPRPPGQTRLSPSTSGTSKTKPNTQTTLRLKSSPSTSAGGTLEHPLLNGEARGAAAGPSEGDDSLQSSVSTEAAEVGGACCAELLKAQSQKQSKKQEKAAKTGEQQPASQSQLASRTLKLSKTAARGKTKPAVRQDSGSLIGNAKLSTAAASGREKAAAVSAVSTGREKTTKRAGMSQDANKPKTKDNKTAENLRKTQSGLQAKQEKGTKNKPTSSQPLKAKPRSAPVSTRDSDTSRTSSGSSSQVSSPRSTSNGAKSAAVNKNKNQKMQFLSSKENDAVYAKCTSMRIAAMKKQKPFDSDYDCETESVISMLSHVAVQGSRTPSIVEIDYPMNGFSSYECSLASRPSSVNVQGLSEENQALRSARYEEVQLSPALDHRDIIVPVLDATFSIPDATKDC